MADITITINDRDVRTLLQRAPQRLESAIRGALTDSATMFYAQMRRYPPQRTGSTYRRTGTLGRSWSVRPIQRTGSGWGVTVGSSGNIAPYNRHVQGDRQARVHRGRWRTAQTVVEQSRTEVQRFADSRIRAALAGV